MKEVVNIVWFKRDLRVQDHLPLHSASEVGKVLPLYIVEPEYWSLPDTSARQYQFISQSLTELDLRLTRLGQPLVVRVGDAVAVLKALSSQLQIDAIYSHEETGNLWTYDRDKAVMSWCREKEIPWYEAPQFGVFQSQHIQLGRRSQGLELLKSFLSSRGRYYQKRLSSPLTAFEHCSRLSPHISYGTLSCIGSARHGILHSVLPTTSQAFTTRKYKCSPVQRASMRCACTIR